MKDLHAQVPIEWLCGLFDKSRQAFYQRQQVIYKQAVEEHFILSQVHKIRQRQPRIGGRKLLVKLGEIGVDIGRDALFEILRDNGLLVRRRRNGVRTTNSSHWLRKYPNLIRHFEAMRPNRLWVSDITYLETIEGFEYLFLITDAYSHKIIGWRLAPGLHSVYTLDALNQAIKQAETAAISGLIHHSDRGSQYCCDLYVQTLTDHQIAISMTEDYKPTDNAIAERVNGIIKQEWLYKMEQFESLEEVEKKIGQIIDFYNTKRPHMSNNMLTPEVAHKGTGVLKRCWKNKVYTPIEAISRDYA